MKLKVGTFCSGIGAPEVAMRGLEFESVFVSEIEPFPCAVSKHHMPDVPNLGDMTAVDGAAWRGKVDVIVAGTPCQAFSVAGMRKGLADARGNLTMKLVELVDAIQPSCLLWENVPGVLSDKGNAFGCFLAGLAGETVALLPPGGRWANAGYVLGPQRAVAWRVLDAQYFGVAQRRRRVFLVACPRNGADPRAVLFESEGVRRDTTPSRGEGQGVAGTIEASLGRSRGAGTPAGAITQDIAYCLGASPATSRSPDVAGGRGTVVTVSVDILNHSTNEIAHTISARNDMQAGAVLGTWPAEVAPTLNAAFGAKQGLEDQHALGWAGLFVPVTQYGDQAGTLTARHDSSPCADRGMNVVAFHPTQGPISSTDGSTHALGCGSKSGTAMYDVVFGIDAERNAYTDMMGTLKARNRGYGGCVGAPGEVAYSRGQETCVGCGSIGGQASVAVAFQPGNLARGAGSPPSFEVFPTLRTSKGCGTSDQDPHVAVAFAENSRAEVRLEGGYGQRTGAISTGGGKPGQGVPMVDSPMAVRRLTPRECEALQGFPPDYTLIPWRNKPASECPDGPRYKALGNSMAVPCIRWIMKRIQKELTL